MTTKNAIDSLISQTNSLRGALFAIKNNVDLFGGCNLAYEHKVRANAHIRGDLITMTTLPREFTDLYYPSGGTNNDPVIENIDGPADLIEVDLASVVSDRSSKYYANPFFSALLRKGQISLASYSSTDPTLIGHMALTVFEAEEQRQARPDVQTVLDLFGNIRASLLKHGHFVRYFELTTAECNALQRSAEGRSGEDIADEEGVTRRTVELRLQSARKKLRARSTTEAVYKAVAYGILPFNQSD